MVCESSVGRLVTFLFNTTPPAWRCERVWKTKQGVHIKGGEMSYTVFTLTPCSHNNNLTYLFQKKLNYSSYFATVCKEPCIMNNLARFYHHHLNETAWVGKRKHQHTSQQMKRSLLEYRRHKTSQSSFVQFVVFSNPTFSKISWVRPRYEVSF